MNDAEYADKVEEELAKKFRKIYRQAEKDIKQKLADFVEKNKIREAQWAEMVEKGEKTQKEFDNWKRTQLYAGKSWENQQKNIAYALAHSNEIANDLVNDRSLDVFAYGGNYAAYEFEDGFKVHIGFDLYDQKTVERLIKDDPQILPPKKLDKAKDVRWNMKNVRSQVALGIIQGESVNKVAKRLASVVPNRNEKQMRLHARTALTGAHNAGRMERYKEAEEMGIKFKKVWLSTHDGRARDLHLGLDEQAVNPEEPFEIDGYEIMYPGEAGAEPEMVYNCRCTMVTELNSIPSQYAQNIRPKGVSFEEWEREKVEEETYERNPLRELTRIKATMSEKDYAEYYNMLNENEYVKGLYEKYGEDIPVERTSNGGAYNISRRSVRYSLGGGDGYYACISHEYGHAFDDYARNDFGVKYSEVDLLNQRCKIGSGQYKLFSRNLSQSDEYLSALRKDKDVIREMLMNPEAMKELKADNLSAGIQDFADGLFGTQDRRDAYHLPWGHGNSYYNREYNRRIVGFGVQNDLKGAFQELGFDASNQNKVKTMMRQYETASELWANQVSALTTGGKQLEYMEKYAPNTLSVMKDILRNGK